jgi:hypothetical protein
LDTFFFLAFCSHDELDPKTKCVTVIDLGHNVSYQRHDWNQVDEVNYDNLQDALVAARAFANAHALPYILFDSRYDSSTSEEPLESGSRLIPPVSRPIMAKTLVTLETLSFDEFSKTFMQCDYTTKLVHYNDEIFIVTYGKTSDRMGNGINGSHTSLEQSYSSTNSETMYISKMGCNGTDIRSFSGASQDFLDCVKQHNFMRSRNG